MVGARTEMCVQVGGYRWWQVPPTRDGIRLSWLSWVPGRPWLSPAVHGWPDSAESQFDDRASLIPSFQPVRVEIHTRGGPA